MSRPIRPSRDRRKCLLASLAGFEPATRCLEGSCSVHLSYRDTLPEVCSSLATAIWTVKKRSASGRGEIGEPMPHVSVVRIQTTETGRLRIWRVAPISRSWTSGRVVKWRWTKFPTGRLRVLEATRAAIAPRAPAQNPRLPLEAINAASPPMRAPTTRLVPQNVETARSECPAFIRRRDSWAASETTSGGAVDQITKPGRYRVSAHGRADATLQKKGDGRVLEAMIPPSLVQCRYAHAVDFLPIIQSRPAQPDSTTYPVSPPR